MILRPAAFLLLSAFAACACSALPAASAKPVAPAPEGVDIVSRHAIAMEKPHGGPTGQMATGPLLGNGDVGVMQSGPADALVFYIGKNDFWSQKTQSPIAVGQLRLRMPALKGASFKSTEDMRLAEIRGAYAQGGAALASRAWVDANQNLFCVELTNGGTLPLEVAVETGQGAGKEKTAGDFLYNPDAPSPAGRKLGLAVRRVGQADARMFTLAPGEKTTLVIAIQSDLDAAGKDPLEAAKGLASSVTPASLAQAADAHRQWWRDYWGRSFIEIPDKTIEQCWYSSWYIMGSCSRAGKVAPGLWGNWITVDNPAWHGDWHLNYNFQAPFYGLYSANHADITLPFYAGMNQSIPRGQKIAKARGWKGIHLPVSIGPWGMCPEGDNSDFGQRSDAAYSAMPYLWYWQHTGDNAWLKREGYAYVREVAAFWEDYLKLEDAPGGGQRYVIHNDAIHEGHTPQDVNGLLSLGLVRAVFENVVPMSEALGVDGDKRDKWRDISKRLSAFPTQERGGKTVFRYTERGLPWWDGNTLGIQHIFPAGAIGLGSDPKLLEISRNMIDTMARWRDYNGSSSWYTACARVGYDPVKILAELRRLYDHHSLPNKLLNFGGGGIENVSPALAVTEMLMQSHDGVIRFFPCWPRNLDARFGGLRARGAFLVWAQLKDGTVSGVKIASEKGGDCILVNPWPGRQAQVMRDGKPAATVSGERFTLKTGAGETVELEAK